MDRRTFLRTAGGATATAAGAGVAAGPAAAAKKKPDFGGWLQDVDGGFTDARGKKEVTVAVGASGNGGNYAFAPAGLWVDAGTTVRWKWTGKGGAHNVVAKEGPADLDSGSPVSKSGVHYTHTFEKGGITKYFCEPHRSLGMKGAVAVGDGVPTESAGGGGQKELEEMGVPIRAHYVGIAAVASIAVSLVFTFFTLKYGESPHASGGNT